MSVTGGGGGGVTNYSLNMYVIRSHPLPTPMYYYYYYYYY